MAFAGKARLLYSSVEMAGREPEEAKAAQTLEERKARNRLGRWVVCRRRYFVGLIKGSKVQNISADARRAVEEGRHVFVARYWDEIVAFQGTGSVSGAADAIESVEREGWMLAHVAYSWVEKKNRGVQVLTFRRA